MKKKSETSIQDTIPVHEHVEIFYDYDKGIRPLFTKREIATCTTTFLGVGGIASGFIAAQFLFFPINLLIGLLLINVSTILLYEIFCIYSYTEPHKTKFSPILHILNFIFNGILNPGIALTLLSLAFLLPMLFYYSLAVSIILSLSSLLPLIFSFSFFRNRISTFSENAVSNFSIFSCIFGILLLTNLMMFIFPAYAIVSQLFFAISLSLLTLYILKLSFKTDSYSLLSNLLQLSIGLGLIAGTLILCAPLSGLTALLFTANVSFLTSIPTLIALNFMLFGGLMVANSAGKTLVALFHKFFYHSTAVNEEIEIPVAPITNSDYKTTTSTLEATS